VLAPLAAYVVLALRAGANLKVSEGWPSPVVQGSHGMVVRCCAGWKRRWDEGFGMKALG